MTAKDAGKPLLLQGNEAAVEGALDSARETMSTEMAKVTSGMGLPDGMEMPF